MTLTLNPIHSGGEGRRLASGSLLIGRDPRAQLRISDPTASGRHCVISGQGGDWQIQDFSRNGTFLNGQKLEGRQRLNGGDRVRIANSEWEVGIDISAVDGDATYVRAVTPGDPMERTRTHASPPLARDQDGDALLATAVEIVAELARTRKQARASLVGGNAACAKSPLADASPGQALAVLKAMQQGSAEAVLKQTASELRSHDVALLEAMQAALHAVLDQFSPEEIQRGGKSDAQAWQAYRKAFEDPDLGFVELFARTFEQKYRDLTG